MRIEFPTIPPIGLAITVDGLRFDLMSIDDHVTRDGRPTKLLAWSGNCADCGTAFVTRSPATRPPESKRCDLHREPGHKVRPA
jgi:hypothetical protein